MYRRHLELPVYMKGKIDLPARYFNRVQVALRRFGEPLRINLPGLRTLSLIVQRESWVVVDQGLNDIPVVAWCHFDKEERHAIHQPVPCSVLRFHARSAVIEAQALDLMEGALAERLLSGGMSVKGVSTIRSG